MSRITGIESKYFLPTIRYKQKMANENLKDIERALETQSKIYNFDTGYITAFWLLRELAEAYYCAGEPLQKVEECFEGMREYCKKYLIEKIRKYSIHDDLSFKWMSLPTCIFYLLDKPIDFYDPRSITHEKLVQDFGPFSLYLYSLLTLNEKPADILIKKGWRQSWDLQIFHEAVLKKDAKTVLKILKNQTKRFEKADPTRTQMMSEPSLIRKEKYFYGVWDYYTMAMTKYSLRHGVAVNYTTNYFMEELMLKYP